MHFWFRCYQTPKHETVLLIHQAADQAGRLLGIGAGPVQDRPTGALKHRRDCRHRVAPAGYVR